MIIKALFVGMGGFLGAILRYLTNGLIQASVQDPSFPYGTLVVNMLGSLLIGFLSGLIEAQGTISPKTQVFLITGTLGAFTTFSTFSYETTTLLRAQQQIPALLNLGLQIMLGLLAVWGGFTLAHKL